MTAVALLAHDDPQGDLAQHVLRLVGWLGEVVDDVVVLPRTPLSGDAVRALRGCRVVEATPAGGPAGAWRLGWESLGSRPARVLLADDDLVGPLPAGREPRLPPEGLRGLAAAPGPVPLVDRRLLDLGPAVLEDPLLDAVWAAVPPSTDVGGTRRVVADLCRWAAASGHRVQADLEVGSGDAADPLAALTRRRARRLPFLALTALRHAGRGREALLGDLRRRHPHELDGVAEHLARTDLAVGVRPSVAGGGAA